MQRDAEQPDVRSGYILATWLQRLTAYFMDRLMVGVIFGLGAVGIAAAASDDFDLGDNEETAWLNDMVGGELGLWVLSVAGGALFVYAVWFLSALRSGQTPGKQLVGIRVIRSSGEMSAWGHTFVREFILGWLVVGLLSVVTVGIFYVVNYLWPLWNKDRQALHDKMAETLVVMKRPLSGRQPLAAAPRTGSAAPGTGSAAPGAGSAAPGAGSTAPGAGSAASGTRSAAVPKETLDAEGSEDAPGPDDAQQDDGVRERGQNG